MAKLKKLNTDNIYDKIGQNAPVVKSVQKVAERKEPEPVQEVVEPAKEVKAVSNASASNVVDLLNPDKKPKKTASIYLRCKKEVKEKFDALCKEKGISQADMFEYWVKTLLK